MRPRTACGRQAAPTIETMRRSVPAWSPRATSKVCVTKEVDVSDKIDAVTLAIPVDIFAVQITRAEEAEARRKGRRTGGIGWQALASRRGNP